MSIRVQDRTLLTVAEALYVSGYQRSTLQSYIQEGVLYPVKHGATWYIDEVELHRLVRSVEREVYQSAEPVDVVPQTSMVAVWASVLMLVFLAALSVLYLHIPNESTFVLEGSEPKSEEMVAFAGGFLSYVKELVAGE